MRRYGFYIDRYTVSNTVYPCYYLFSAYFMILFEFILINLN